MLAFVLSDNPAIAEKLRQVLTRVGHECPAEHQVPLEKTSGVLAMSASSAVAVVVDLSSNLPAALRAISQIRQKTSGLIVAVGPRQAELILNAVRIGAHDYVDQSLVDDELPRSIARECAARGFVAPEGQLILVMSGSGGCGRSQIATNLAVLLARQEGRSCLVELDIAGGNCASMLSLKPRHTILDLCRHSRKLDRKLLEKTLIPHESGVSLLPAPAEVAAPETLTGEFVERLASETRSMFSRVVMDYQDLWNADLLKQLVPQIARCLLVTRLDFNSVCNTGRALSHLERLGVDRQRITLVANRHNEPGDVPARKIEQVLSIRINHLIPDDARTVHASINSGIPYVLGSPAAAISKALTGLAGTFASSHARSAGGDIAGEQTGAPESGFRPKLFRQFRSMIARLA